jgi:hypothetical protein
MTINQPRASKGGEVGINGLYYSGGSFLPSTDNAKLPKRRKGKGTGKQEIAPYEWAVSPVGFESIFHRLKAFVDSEMNLVPAAIEYYKADADMVHTYINLHKAGWRYIAESEFLNPIETPNKEYILEK